jgi:AcrR family transcriptional regulator
MVVDHAARRRRIAEATATVAAREGLDAATIRRIAAELGGPTKLVTYYFADKEELLRFTYEHLAQQYLDEVIAHDPGDIIGMLMPMAATDPSRIVRWRFYLAFWDHAARSPAFAELQRAHTQRAMSHIAGVLRARLGGDADVETISLVLNALVQGLSLQALADPEHWSAERIRAALTEVAARMLGEPALAPAPPAVR